MAEAQPQRIGRYEVEGVLGRGGTSTVYRGSDPQIGRTVAIKVLAEQDDDSAQRFLIEMQVLGRLNHPNIAAVFDAGRTEDGQVFVVQEFVDGLDLGRIIAAHPQGLPSAVATGLLLQIAQALAHAHERGIVHRDVKPSNVAVLVDGKAKLLDFGIARIVQEPSDRTQVGTMVGTPHYMSPEQMMGEQVGVGADIYSFGVLAYELLSGHRPFGGSNMSVLIYKILNDKPEPVSKWVPSLPSALVGLIDACLEKAIDRRPTTMSEVAEVLESLEHHWDASVLVAPLGSPRADDLISESHATRTLTGLAPPPPTATLAGAPVPDPTIVGPAQPPAGTTRAPPVPHPPTFEATGTRAIRADWRDLTGKTVGRFVLHERIARGQSGDLYKAWDPSRGELVGVKVVHANDADARQRLLRGGRIWLKLNHPHIVRVIEVHPDYDGLPGVIVSEIIDGINLDELAAQRHLSLAQSVWIVMQVCEALGVIHALGVVHREVKPRNILVSGDDLHVTLLDSGIARHANPEVDAFTKVGVLVGDLTYAAPEMAVGRSDQRTDVYAVVAVLYELVTQSKLPFPMESDWQPTGAALDALPARLRAVLARGLQMSPAARFNSIGELHDQLRPLAPDRQRASKSRAVVALHGIRTQAAWQRAFSEVAGRSGLAAHVDRWNFGYFSVFRFLMPWARLAKVRWFRTTYQQEFREAGTAAATERPSIVAHSFGTYILGNALLRYPYLRFDKVLLCGSILPRSFPWDQIVERGQVQALRNEYGSHDVWTRAVAWVVPGTGPSGLLGFTAQHARIEQERFNFEHSEYFERGHMDNRWLPFLTAEIEQRPARDSDVTAPPEEARPWVLYVIYMILMAAAAAAWLALR